MNSYHLYVILVWSLFLEVLANHHKTKQLIKNDKKIAYPIHCRHHNRLIINKTKISDIIAQIELHMELYYILPRSQFINQLVRNLPISPIAHRFFTYIEYETGFLVWTYTARAHNKKSTPRNNWKENIRRALPKIDHHRTVSCVCVCVVYGWARNICDRIIFVSVWCVHHNSKILFWKFYYSLPVK